jgi:NitT/TauT family transport system substrate-binding protein
MTLDRRSFLTAAATVAVASATQAPAAEVQKLSLGLLHTLSPAPFYLAQGRGYFRDHGLDVSFVYFNAAQPISAAVVAGDVDVGLTALTGGFFNLAEKGALRVIGGGLHEEKGVQGTALLVSDKAYAAGLTTPDKLAGHSVAITQYGSSFHYMLGRLAQAEGFDLKAVEMRPVQTIQNMLAAVGTGQVDATFAVASMAKPAAAARRAHIIAWMGDIVPYQITALFTTERTIRTRADALHRFADAYRQGVADYRTAFFSGPPTPATDAAIAIITKYVFTGDPNARAKILAGVGNYPPDGALDVQDVKAQLAWFHQQGLVKGDADPASLIDTSFLPAA